MISLPFMLHILLSVQGVGSASGLVMLENQIYMVSDNSNYLYRVSTQDSTMEKVLVLDRGVNEQVPKKQKSDFEAITQLDSTLYLFGSGSGKSRQNWVRYDLATGERDSLDRSALYKKLQERFAIAEDDFNIEGALFYGEDLWLFNRGNGPGLKNGIFIVGKDDLEPKAFHAVPLARLGGIPLGFTDAILVNDRVYFTAAAEDSGSNYHDGGIAGTVLGCFDPKSMKMDFIETLSTKQKFEGISLFKQTDSALEFVLCEDPDSGMLTSTIYHLTVPR